VTGQERNATYVAVAAGLICLAVYLRALGCGFVDWDDHGYILNNTTIRTMDRSFFATVFSPSYFGFWMPLTWISLAIDYRFWGVDPFGYHLTNILLHAANTGLVVLIADRLCRDRFAGGPAPLRSRFLYPGMLLLAGLLFGIHPLRAESVAWATERKDVLNGLFTLGSVLAYLRHAREREAGRALVMVSRPYLLSLALFACSLMAKSVSVVLPLLLLVADFYPLERFRKGRALALVAEKAPFLLLSAGMAFLTLQVAARDSILVSGLSLSQRLVISGHAVFEYCRLMLWPAGIIPLYIVPDPLPVSYTVETLAVAVACLGIGAAWRRAWLPAVWLSFLIPLLPVLAFAQNGIQSLAARFTYLPSVGPSIAVAFLLAAAWSRRARALQRSVAVLVVAVLVFYAALTQRQIDVWQDTGSLWSRVIAIAPFDRAYFYRGLFHADSGRYDAAVADYSACLEIALSEKLPEAFNLYAFRGEALVRAGRYEEAVADLTTAIGISPHPVYFHHRGLALKGLGRMAEAEEDFRRAGTATGQVQWYPS
jgi:protein O-mannosyl-transferase